MSDVAASALDSPDQRWMERALALAEQGVGLASPNPTVGCVIVRDNIVLGEGFHHYDLLDHAEVAALKTSSADVRGATAYVTLEPCSHTGRTGPCADALIAAGIARVVVATEDPNPQVSGRGIARLRAAGLEVAVGPGQERARGLNDTFARYIRTGLPFVTLKAGLSLDGRIAPAPSFRGPAGPPTRPVYLTSVESLEAVHRLRHGSDAILTGIGTVLHDNPLLTDRSGLPRRRPLLRVILDSELRTPLDSRLVTTAGPADLLLCTASRNEARLARMREAGVEVEQVEASPTAGAGVDLAAVLKLLGGRYLVQSVLIEGGSRLNRVALESAAVDRLLLFYAPLFLGEAGVPLVSGDTGLRPTLVAATTSPSGPDFRFDACLRDPWN